VRVGHLVTGLALVDLLLLLFFLGQILVQGPTR
jgi:hypothetical protein